MNETDNGLYLAYLLSVERDSVTFGLDTWSRETDSDEIEMFPAGEPDTCCKDFPRSGSMEIRFPTFVMKDKINKILIDFDRGAQIIQNWQQLFRWLGSDPGQGWALFTQESAAVLVPHWFCPGAKYRCVCATNGWPFVDERLCPNLCSVSEESLKEMVGSSPEKAAGIRLIQIACNMVITRQRLFG